MAKPPTPAGGAQAWPWPRRPLAVWLPLGSRLCLAAPSPASQRQRCRCCCRCPAAAATCGSSHTVPPTVHQPHGRSTTHCAPFTSRRCPLWHRRFMPCAGRPVSGSSGAFRFRTSPRPCAFGGGCEADGQKFGVGRSTRQRTTALLGHRVHALCWPPRLGLFRRFSISDLSAPMCFWGGVRGRWPKVRGRPIDSPAYHRAARACVEPSASVQRVFW